jgi:hypothetical protein
MYAPNKAVSTPDRPAARLPLQTVVRNGANFSSSVALELSPRLKGFDDVNPYLDSLPMRSENDYWAAAISMDAADLSEQNQQLQMVLSIEERAHDAVSGSVQDTLSHQYCTHELACSDLLYNCWVL